MAKVKQRGEMWYSNFTNPNGSGKKVVLVMDADERTAQKMADALEAKMSAECPRGNGAGTNLAGMDPTVFVQYAIDEHFGMTDKKNTCATFKMAMRALRAAVPVKRVSDITVDVIGKMKKAWVKNGTVQQQEGGNIAGAGVAGANKRVRVLLTLMRWAEDQPGSGLVPQKWKSIKPWKEGGGRLLRYTKDQHAALVEATAHKDVLNPGIMRTLYMLCYNVGLRPGEARWLWKQDVELYPESRNGIWGLIHIQTKSYTDANGKKVIWSPKSENGKYDCTRSIPMNAALANYMRNWLAVIPGPWVLSLTSQPAFKTNTLSHQWTKVVKLAEEPGMLYTLRHSYASDLIAGGENIFVVQQHMGHASVKTTEIYIHFKPKHSIASGALHAPEFKGPMAMMGAA